MGQSEKMEQEDNRPKWLLELENRKRKPRLAHEVGAGAPCMTCSSACPGLDLHFWRKICKNCKCSRDDHDVPNDEFPQFDLLFGPTGKPNRKMIVLKVNKKQAEAEITFEWAPPDTTKELAADYMKALPEDKLPIKGSAGAVLRKQQLQRQLPLHDIDHKVCDELSESERKQFEKYLENLKKYVGQGKVIKAMGARPFDISLMTPANATDMNRFSPKHKPTPPESSHSLNLRTPSSFVPKTPFSPHSAAAEAVNGLQNRGIGSPARDQCPSSASRLERVHSPALSNSSYESPLQGKYHHVLANVRNDGETLSSKPVGGTRYPPLHFTSPNKIPDPAYTSPAGENKPINPQLQSLSNPQNTSLASSDPVGGIYNPAVQFAASNMIGDPSILMNSGKSGPLDRGLNHANSNTFSDHELPCPSSSDAKLHSSRIPAPGENLAVSSSVPGTYNPGFNAASQNNRQHQESAKNADSELGKLYSSRNPAENLAVSSSIPGAYNPGFKVLQNDGQNSELERNAESELAKNREEENSLLAEKMLNEALLPPSAIHAADIIGSTLDEKGLSFIREKLSSKYSAKEEPVSLQSAGRARELGERKEGVKTKRADQLRRQGAFDKEAERTDIIAAMKNPSGTMSDEFPTEYLEDSIPSSSQTEKCLEGQNGLGERLKQANSNYPLNEVNGSNEKHISGAFKDESGNEPWRQVMRGICDNYLTNPGYAGDPGRLQDRNSSGFENTSGGSSVNSEPTRPGSAVEALRAELSSYGPGNTNLICSEGQNNSVFPEEAIVSSGIVQNPVSVDRLRGAMEELSMCQSKVQNCHQCQEGVRPGDVVVTAEKANDAVWHPGCFVCSVCNELLADLVYFYYKGKLYCGRDLATLLEIPRCFACDELIFVREYTVAEGHNYHIKHFCCWDCDEPLAGQQYISENDRPLCLPCYQRTYAKTCRTCEGVIAADQQGVTVKNLNFHANDDCFCCAICRKSLLNGKMAIKEDRPFCSKECITKFLNDKTS